MEDSEVPKPKLRFADDVEIEEYENENDDIEEEINDLRRVFSTNLLVDRYNALQVLGNYQNKLSGMAEHDEDPADNGNLPSSSSSKSTVGRKSLRFATVRRAKAEIGDTGYAGKEMLRLQHELKLSNTTARVMDEVILRKHQDDISKQASEAQKDIETERQLEPIAKFSTIKVPSSKSAAGPITMDERVDRAATYVKDSISGRATAHFTSFQLMFTQFTSRTAYQTFIFLVILFHLCIVFGEPPSQTYDNGVSSTTTRGLLAAELVCILIYFVDIVLRFCGNDLTYFWKSPARMAFVVVSFVILVDVCAALGHHSVARPTRCLRPFLLISKSRTLRDITFTIARTCVRLVDLVLLVLIIMITYAVVGVQLFNGFYSDDPNLDSYANFDNLPDALLGLFVLLTTENYPEFMVPAYNRSKWSVVYFLSFLIIVVYLLLSVLVAVVLDTYKTLRKEKLIQDRVTERKGLATAFQLLDVNNEGHIHYDLWEALLKKVSPQIDANQVRLLFQTIDEDKNGLLNVMEFFELCDVLLLRFRKDDTELRGAFAKQLQNCFGLVLLRRGAIAIVKSRVFQVIIIMLIVANIVVLCLLGQVSQSQTPALYVANLVLLCLFIVEMIIKLIAWGWFLFWRNTWNRFDLVIVAIVTAAQIVVLAAASDQAFVLTTKGYVRFFNAVSAIRVLRIISSFRRTRLITHTVMKLAPLMLSVVSLLLCVFYFYCVIGMQIFAGQVRLSSVISFDTFPAAMLTMFQQLTQANWQDVMYPTMHITDKYSSWYFLTFNIMVVIIILNLLIALVIDTFVLQHEILQSAQDILLEIPDAEQDTTIKTRWRVFKSIGKNWERELINRREIPDLDQTMMEEARHHADDELRDIQLRDAREHR